MSFKKNKYQVIREAKPKELANFGFTYLKISAEADYWMINNNITHKGNPLVGNFNDPQVPNSYAKYADRFMETLLIKTIDVMQKKTGLSLVPTYSYTRLYRKGNILKRHKDRPSCDISTTLNLGGDDWPIYLDPTGKTGQAGVKINLKPGDMLIYSGCDLEHWREEFTGKDCGQVFLHYNKASSKTAKENQFDNRPFIGLPSWYKGFKLPKK